MHATASATALAIRNILLATDFSACSERALLHAVAAAQRLGSTLHLLHVIKPETFSLIPPEGYLGHAEAANQAAELARADAGRLLKNVLLRSQCQDIRSRIWVEIGAVGEELNEIIQREHIDLVVVGTRGRTGLRKMVLGSVAEEIFRQASCPVLTVGPNSWESDPQSVRLKHILFPTNLSENSAGALPFAIAMAAEFNAALILLNVIESHGAGEPEDRTRLVAASQAGMREMIRSAAATTSAQVSFQVMFGDVAERIIETAAGQKIDLIIGGLGASDVHRESLRWENAYKVVCHVACPVLTLRGPHCRN